MALSTRTLRSRLSMLHPQLKGRTPEAIRKTHKKLGELIETKYRSCVLVKEHAFSCFSGAWLLPKDERRQGVILYLHDGGFVSGDWEDAVNAGAVAAVQTGTRVLCPVYRLAPEHPFPAALEDALEAYRYLLSKGYQPGHITLWGTGSGGGLCFSLCLKLKEMELPQPACIIGASPWVNLEVTGEDNRKTGKADPAVTFGLLRLCARYYGGDPAEALVSPVLGQLEGMPPVLMFAGEEELLGPDIQKFHEKLLRQGTASSLILKPDRWHGYLRCGLKEDHEDFDRISAFLNEHMAQENKLRWMPLDNTAKIYPAARNQNWSNVFRLSATLKEPVDVTVLQSALDVTVRRFPSIATRLRRGLFWYYLEQLERAPEIREEHSFPLAKMSKAETSRCAFRVIAYNRRIAVEMFHSITDGNGALVFLKSLVAEYLQQKYGIHIPAEHGVLGRLEAPCEEEMEDSFLRYAGPVRGDRKEPDAWQLRGTPELDGFAHITCMRMSAQKLLSEARARGITLTTYLCAAMMLALQNVQRQQVPNPARRKHIKVFLPVNLRRMFPSRSLRNFILYTTPAIDPRQGEYSFEEICRVVHHHMGLELTEKKMRRLMATNVSSEQNFLIKIVPLFIKNPIMKLVFNLVGERKSCLSLSNLGAVKLPEVMMPYVERMDFILGMQNTGVYNCGVLSFGDTVYLNFTRKIREPELEYQFYQVLRDLGIPVTVESNRPVE